MKWQPSISYQQLSLDRWITPTTLSLLQKPFRWNTKMVLDAIINELLFRKTTILDGGWFSTTTTQLQQNIQAKDELGKPCKTTIGGPSSKRMSKPISRGAQRVNQPNQGQTNKKSPFLQFHQNIPMFHLKQSPWTLSPNYQKANGTTPSLPLQTMTVQK